MRPRCDNPGKNSDLTVEVAMARPSWWKDATHAQRYPVEGYALSSASVQRLLTQGYAIVGVKRPRCECNVQACSPEERDPTYLGANGACRRCSGPLS